MPLSEFGYCVAIPFKITERVEQQRICIRFCIKVEHSSMETVWMIQKAKAVGNWWPTASSRQCARSCTISCAVFWWNFKSPGDSAPVQIWHAVTSGFSQNYYHLWTAGDLRLSVKFRKTWWGSWWQLEELCEVPRCLFWRGLRRLCPIYNVSCIFFNKCLYFFILHGWIPFGLISYI